LTEAVLLEDAGNGDASPVLLSRASLSLSGAAVAAAASDLDSESLRGLEEFEPEAREVGSPVERALSMIERLEQQLAIDPPA
jgi:hypothetical protein